MQLSLVRPGDQPQLPPLSHKQLFTVVLQPLCHQSAKYSLGEQQALNGLS